jgi:DNA-binding LacI/PurR family transcriptional regulator
VAGTGPDGSPGIHQVGRSPPTGGVPQDVAEIGRRSIQMLLHEIEDSSRDVGTTIVPTSLVVRESTASPRA